MPRHSEATLAAIKNGVDIVALVADCGLPLTRVGSKFKALCPFHDDHKPSLELNPERQSFKCWSCGAGGDVFDFVKDYLRVEFPEALRMLADRAGVALDTPESAFAPADGAGQVTKSDLLAVNAWAEGIYAEAMARSEGAKAYVKGRGIGAESVERFRLGYAPDERGWFLAKAKRAGYSIDLLEKAGLVSCPADAPGLVRERFLGRLIFPIHDAMGRSIGFGGRVLPEVERFLAARGKNVAKYLNSPETLSFQKRRVLYAGDLARADARQAGWVAVVEGYTDVIAAHQVGLRNVVGTLGTALGDDHVVALRRLTDRVVLVFDGDDAGQAAADRALELFLGHEVDVRVLTLPESLDPCDFLLKEGAEPFRALVADAIDPLAFALDRASRRFDFRSLEDSRRASEWVLGILGRVPESNGVGLDVKVAKALDTLATRLRVPVETLKRRLREIRQAQRPRSRPASVLPMNPDSAPAQSPPAPPFRLADLDPTDRELLQIVLNDPASVGRVISRVAAPTLRDAPLREILQTCFDLYGEGLSPNLDRLSLRLGDRERALAAGLLLTVDPDPRSEAMASPAPWGVRLDAVLAKLDQRDREERIRSIQSALNELDPVRDSETYRALRVERFRLESQRPDSKQKTAS